MLLSLLCDLVVGRGFDMRECIGWVEGQWMNAYHRSFWEYLMLMLGGWEDAYIPLVYDFLLLIFVMKSCI